MAPTYSIRSLDQLKSLLTISEAAKIASVCPATIRNWSDSGQLACIRTIGNQRRFRRSDVLEAIGLEDEKKEENVGRSILLYARVSGAKQGRNIKNDGDSDLQRQRDKLREYARKNFPNGQVFEFVEIGSGMNYEKEKLQDLITQIVSGRHDGGVLLINYWDRLLRFGVELVQCICRARNIEIVCVSDDPEKKSEDESLAESILAFITCYSSKLYSRRGAEARRRRMEPAKIEEAIELLSKGHTYKEVTDKFRRDGTVDQDGRPFTYATIKNIVQRHKKALGLIQHQEKKPVSNTLTQFLSERTKPTRGKDMPLALLVANYKRWTKRKGCTRTLTEPRIRYFLKRIEHVMFNEERGLIRNLQFIPQSDQKK